MHGGRTVNCFAGRTIDGIRERTRGRVGKGFDGLEDPNEGACMVRTGRYRIGAIAGRDHERGIERNPSLSKRIRSWEDVASVSAAADCARTTRRVIAGTSSTGDENE